jgi:hypothetical protein
VDVVGVAVELAQRRVERAAHLGHDLPVAGRHGVVEDVVLIVRDEDTMNVQGADDVSSPRIGPGRVPIMVT